MNHEGGEWVIVYRSGSARECHEFALVLQAVEVDYEIRQDADGFALLVNAVDAARSFAELSAYANENRDWVSEQPEVLRRADGWNGVLGFGTVLLVVGVMAQRRLFGMNWFAQGETDAGLIRAGEWWRAVTALTLHADPVHLLANLIIGGLLVFFSCQVLGSGFASFMILVGGAMGNLLNAAIRPAEHTSIGASTAVFAALGILSVKAWRQRRSPQSSRLGRWAPFVGGAVLLSFLGTSGERTDVGAHVLGFLCGVLTGAVTGKFGDQVFARRAQSLFGLAALLLIAFSWLVALMRHPNES